MELSRGYRRLVKAVIIIDSGLNPASDIGNPDDIGGAVLGGMIDVLAGPKGKNELKKMYAGFFNEKSDRIMAENVASDAIRTPMPVVIEELRDLAISSEAIAANIRQPVLWLTVGAIDEAYIRSHLKNVQFCRTVGSGHFPHMEVPAQTNAMIETFIAQL